MAVYEYKTKIRFNEINENNELSDKGLLTILSEAAGLHSEKVGYGLNTLDETNCAWMIIYWKVKIFKRPRWNTELTIKTWGREFTKISSWRDFEAYDNTGEKIAVASTEWVLIDAKKGKIGRITDKMIDDYGKVEKQVFNGNLVGKLQEPENMKKVYEYTAERRDIDTNHHVNNIVYLEYAYNALPEDININFNDIEIYYKKQIRQGEKVSIFYGKEENSHFVSIKSLDGNTIHAILKFS